MNTLNIKLMHENPFYLIFVFDLYFIELRAVNERIIGLKSYKFAFGGEKVQNIIGVGLKEMHILYE